MMVLVWEVLATWSNVASTPGKYASYTKVKVVVVVLVWFLFVLYYICMYFLYFFEDMCIKSSYHI